jgi:hypothetical protein
MPKDYFATVQTRGGWHSGIGPPSAKTGVEAQAEKRVKNNKTQRLVFFMCDSSFSRKT